MPEEKKGFDGISDLISDINKIENDDNIYLESKAHKENDEDESNKLKTEQIKIDSKNEDLSINENTVNNQNLTKNSNNDTNKNINEKQKSKTKYFLIIIFLFLSICFIFNQESSKIGSESAAEHSSSVNNIDLEYTIPPIGKSNILSIQQIRWCERQRIRIETLKNYVKSDFAIQKINYLIDDFNNRCSSFKYREKDFSQAKREVEHIREEIVQESINKARYYEYIDQASQSMANNFVTDQASTSINQAELIRETQKLLTKLGYYPGSIDGILGDRTLIAIKLYKKEAQLSPPYDIDENLVNQLRKSIEIYNDLVSSKLKIKLSNLEYRYLIKNSKKFRMETNNLNTTWKRIANACDKEYYSILLHEQNEWIKFGRDNDAEIYINSGYDRKTAYILATSKRINVLNDILFKIKLYQEDNQQNITTKTQWKNSYTYTQQTNNNNFKQMSYEDQSRYKAAIRLQRLGYNIDWRNLSLGNILDIESRINICQRLQKLGYNYDWRNFSLKNLLDIESRISAAQRLNRKGKNIDWRNYSIFQLLNMEHAN